MSVGELAPLMGIQSAEWTLIEQQSLPTALSGNSISVRLGEPYWQVEASVATVPRSALAREWSAFLRRRHGSANTFTMPRVYQAFPLDAASVASDTNLTVAGVDRAASTVTLANIGGTYNPRAGDMIGYFTARSGFYIGEVEQDEDPPFDQVTLKVWPPPFEPHPETANPRRLKALGEFRLLDAPSPTEAFNASRSWRFTAQQVVRG